MNANIIALVVGIVLLGLAGVGGYRAGENAVEVKYKNAALEAASSYAETLGKVTADRAAEKDRVSKLLADTAETHRKELKEHDDAAQKRIDGIRSGTGKLYVDVACPKTGGSPLQQGGGHDAGTPATAAIELPAEVGAGVESVGKECDGLADDYRTLYTRAKAVAGQ